MFILVLFGSCSPKSLPIDSDTENSTYISDDFSDQYDKSDVIVSFVGDTILIPQISLVGLDINCLHCQNLYNNSMVVRPKNIRIDITQLSIRIYYDDVLRLSNIYTILNGITNPVTLEGKYSLLGEDVFMTITPKGNNRYVFVLMKGNDLIYSLVKNVTK